MFRLLELISIRAYSVYPVSYTLYSLRCGTLLDTQPKHKQKYGDRRLAQSLLMVKLPPKEIVDLNEEQFPRFRAKEHPIILDETGNRICRVMVMERLHPIFELTNLDFKQAIRDIVLGSPNSRLACLALTVSSKQHTISRSSTNDDGAVHGVLIDFDLASVELPSSEGHHGRRTGTRCFMAIDLLENETSPHLERFDWEPFFYVICWIGTHYSNGTGVQTDALDELDTDVDKLLVPSKQLMLVGFGSPLDILFMDFYKPLYWTWVYDLQSMFHDAHQAKNESRRAKAINPERSESESLRNALRTKDQQYRDAMDKISLHSLEIDKWQQQQEQMEHTLQTLETQLAMAREAQAQLEEQKQENLLLKETIDRLRFDMDELRTKADGSVPETKGTVSQQGSLSKSLGVELARLNHGKWPGGEESDEEESTTAVSDNESDSGATEGEDVVQTIITRRKKKVASRAMKRVETIQYEDVKHYSDAYTQHEVSEFTASNCVQTDPEPKRPMATLSTQTEMTATTTSLIQTDPEPVPKPVLRLETEIQTDALDSEHSGTFVDDSEASTSKRPNRDLPPSYAESSQSAEDQEQRDMRIASEAILRWHKGLDVPLSPLPKGISDDALEEWAALKQEIGFDCLAIDKVLEMSLKTGCSRDGTRSERSSTAAPTELSSASSRRSRFYNIYNTFVYGKPDAERDQERDRSLAAGLTQAAVVLGGCIVAAGLLSGPYLHPQYNIPGGPTYYDRAAFSEFNNLAPVGEGFVPDGAATVWDFLGRIGGEAARMARGWPS
ncbi:hypothetical protein A7U60_g4694 [Sanghuangporus baumii]|uniref:Fungal-type protein kinase domain-containing protein n=1 Tax=Sanghuangporus baumii TaxID=108892 RepID=A0A9Q5HYC3_SANBA|nr:hypothetical protein A7U60_g4694 [Sanghuangporus baumii]